MSRLRANVSKTPAITLTRYAIESDNVAYIITTNKALKYLNGKSRIAYIGHTTKGASRLATSTFERADLLSIHGVNELSVFCVSAEVQRDHNTANKLESALLVTFAEVYGELPVGNKKSGGQKDWQEFFRPERIRAILEQFEQ